LVVVVAGLSAGRDAALPRHRQQSASQLSRFVSFSFLFVLYSVAALDDILISIVFSPPEPITRSPAFAGRPAVPAHTNDICYDVIVKLAI
jgi:hypothetical protein